MKNVARLVGIVVCVILALLCAWHAMHASELLYTVCLIAASLLGVGAGILKNMGKRF